MKPHEVLLALALCSTAAPLPRHHLLAYADDAPAPRLLPALRTHIEIDDDPETKENESERLVLPQTGFLFWRQDVNEQNARDKVFFDIEADLAKCKAKPCKSESKAWPYAASFILGMVATVVIVSVAR